MKRLAILISLLTACMGATAQTDSVYAWNKWCSRRDTLLLFNGGNNMIHIYCRGMKPADFKLKSLDQSLRIGAPEIKGDTMSVLAMPYPGKTRNMRLAVLNAKTSKPIKTLSFVSDSIPAPVARAGIIQYGEALKKDILSQYALRVVFPKSLYSYPYAIQQYGFRAQTPKGSTSLLVNGSILSKEVLTAINDAPVGTVVTFTAIKATCPECTMRTLEDVKLKIK